MRNAFRLAGFAAALVGATAIVASEESVRLARVVETPEDLATVFSDAQTAATYDSMSGRFYYPSLDLFFDPATSLFYNPATGKYSDSTLWGSYDSPMADGMYYDAVEDLYYDAGRRMTYDAQTGKYHDNEHGLDLSWDETLRMFYDPAAESHFDRGLGVHLTYGPQEKMFWDAEAQSFYDPEIGLYYDQAAGLFYDPLRDRHYDKETGEYCDPETGEFTPDAAGHLHQCGETGYFFCDLDGHYYLFDSSTGLYSSVDSPMGGSHLYYNPDTACHIVAHAWMDSCCLVVETGNIYDMTSGTYIDYFSDCRYRYDAVSGSYVDVDSGSPVTPRSYDGRRMDGRSTPENVERLVRWGYLYNVQMDSFHRADDDSDEYDYDPDTGLLSLRNGGIYGNRRWIPETGMLLEYNDATEVYGIVDFGGTYDPSSQLYYDDYSCAFYRYDESQGRFVDDISGAPYDPYWMNSHTWTAPQPLPQEQVDAVMDQYDLTESGMYFDSSIGAYTDGICHYYDDQCDVDLFYDPSNGLFYDIATGASYCTISGMRTRRSANAAVDLSDMTYDEMYHMYFDSVAHLWYDDVAGLYHDGMSHCDPLTGDHYWHDDTLNRYVNSTTGETWLPCGPSSEDGSAGDGDGSGGFRADNDDMVYDEMLDLYYDPSNGHYYDARVGLYLFGMCYCDPETWQYLEIVHVWIMSMTLSIQ